MIGLAYQLLDKVTFYTNLINIKLRPGNFQPAENGNNFVKIRYTFIHCK